MKNTSSGAGRKPQTEDEKVLRTIEDLRSEVRELRSMVNMLMDLLVNMESHEDMELEMDSNMMGYDPLLKSGRYCM